jgi:hypothetical protein
MKTPPFGLLRIKTTINRPDTLMSASTHPVFPGVSLLLFPDTQDRAEPTIDERQHPLIFTINYLRNFLKWLSSEIRLAGAP